MEELHLTKKDFKIDLYSLTNSKQKNCCKATHIDSGLTSNGTSHKHILANKKEAFLDLTEKVIK